MRPTPIIYCCLIRPGIIFMSLIFGCVGILQCLYDLLRSGFFHVANFEDFLNCTCRIVTIFTTFSFFYSAYLAYKREYKPFKYLLYIFWTNISLDIFSGMFVLKTLFDVTSKSIDIKEKLPYNATENHKLTEDEYYRIAQNVSSGADVILSFIVVSLLLFPFLNKVYLVVKLKAYADYINYKKDASSVPSVKLPHKLPQCSQ
ncbi:hypothetical protein BCR42DRAFT_414534 [Absidia repens]|uniref:Uncharacterized protein n=1 Tax=Absidia repens TaxID=90262 RepID=A0A1X2IKS1_9FUNG|nr:hypothetical protein BCR42DRAFT_414534 [Absidia repens]